MTRQTLEELRDTFKKITFLVTLSKLTLTPIPPRSLVLIKIPQKVEQALKDEVLGAAQLIKHVKACKSM